MFLFYLVPAEQLGDGNMYSFQVSSVSTNSYEAYSTEYEIITPQYRVVQAIVIVAVVLLILLATSLLLFYMKRHLFTYNHDEQKA